MKKLGFLGSVGCAVLLAACGGDEARTGDDQNLTEDEQELLVESEGYVVGSFVSGNKADALASWEKACDAWKTAVADLAGERLLEASCDEPEQLGADFVFGSKARASFLAVTPRGVEAVKASEHVVFGENAKNLVDKIDSWKEACAAEVDRARAIHGKRLLSATCLAPAPDAEWGYWASAFETVTVPEDVGVVELEGTLAPLGDAGNLASALGAWRTACGEWASAASELSGAGLASYECGTPTQHAFTNSFHFASETRLRVQTGKRGATVSSGAPFETDSLSLADALTAWGKACAAEIEADHAFFGERLLAATCGELAHTDNWRFDGAVNKAVASAGETKVTVTGWVMGYTSGNRAKARADWNARHRAWLGRMAESVGLENIEGHQAAPPAVIAEPSWYFAGPVELQLGIDLAEGESVVSETSTLTSPQVSGFDKNIAAWEQKCSDAVEEARAAAGDAFVAAACGKTTLTSGYAFESELTVWTRVQP